MKRIKNYSGFRRLIIDISIEFEIQFIVYWIDIYIFIPDKMAQITHAERISVGGRKGHRREFQRVSRYQEPPSVIQPDVIPYSNIPLCCRARAPHSKSLVCSYCIRRFYLVASRVTPEDDLYMYHDTLVAARSSSTRMSIDSMGVYRLESNPNIFGDKNISFYILLLLFFLNYFNELASMK